MRRDEPARRELGPAVRRWARYFEECQAMGVRKLWSYYDRQATAQQSVD